MREKLIDLAFLAAVVAVGAWMLGAFKDLEEDTMACETRRKIEWNDLTVGDGIAVTCDGRSILGLFDGFAEANGEWCASVQVHADTHWYFPVWMPALIQIVRRASGGPLPDHDWPEPLYVIEARLDHADNVATPCVPWRVSVVWIAWLLLSIIAAINFVAWVGR